jgi:hypothetical protein
MGLLWRLVAPKPLKKARRAVRKATNPLSLITPRPVKQVRRAVSTVVHPIEAVEYGLQSQVVHAVRGGRRKSRVSQATRADGLPHRFTDDWIRKNMPRLSESQVGYVVEDMRKRGWKEAELARRLFSHVTR